MLLALALSLACIAGGGLAPGAARADTTPPVDDSRYAQSLQDLLAGDSPAAQSFWNGLVEGGDGSSIEDFYNASAAAGDMPALEEAAAAAGPEALIIGGGALLLIHVLQNFSDGHQDSKTVTVNLANDLTSAQYYGDESNWLYHPAGETAWVHDGSHTDWYWLARGAVFDPQIDTDANGGIGNASSIIANAGWPVSVLSEQADDPQICGDGVSSHGQPACWGPIGTGHTQLDLDNEARTNGEMWEAIEHVANGHTVPGQVISSGPLATGDCWDPSGTAIPQAGCGTIRYRVTIPELLAGGTLKHLSAPGSSGTGPVTVTVPDNTSTDLQPARDIIDANPTLQTQVNQDLTNTVGTIIVIPDCTGQTYDRCLEQMQNAGVVGTITRVTTDPSTCPNGQCSAKVISQTPAAGSEVLPTGSVTLTTYPDPDQSPGQTGQPGLWNVPVIPWYQDTAQNTWISTLNANPNADPTKSPRSSSQSSRRPHRKPKPQRIRARSPASSSTTTTGSRRRSSTRQTAATATHTGRSQTRTSSTRTRTPPTPQTAPSTVPVTPATAHRRPESPLAPSATAPATPATSTRSISNRSPASRSAPISPSA